MICSALTVKTVLDLPQHLRLTPRRWGWRERGIKKEGAKAECFPPLLFLRDLGGPEEGVGGHNQRGHGPQCPDQTEQDLLLNY